MTTSLVEMETLGREFWRVFKTRTSSDRLTVWIDHQHYVEVYDGAPGAAFVGLGVYVAAGTGP